MFINYFSSITYKKNAFIFYMLNETLSHPYITDEQFLLPWKFILLKKKTYYRPVLQTEISYIWVKIRNSYYDTFTNEIFHLENKIVRLALIVTSVTCNRYRSLFVNIFLEWRAAETSVAKKPKHRYVCAEKQGGIEIPDSG